MGRLPALVAGRMHRMGSIQIPGAPDVKVSMSDRRMLLKRAAGLGLSLPAIGGLSMGIARAQDEGHDHGDLGTPDDGYVGSDPGAPTTGESTPVPGEVMPFTRYDPFIQPVEAGQKDMRVVARDATVYVAKDVAYAGWSFGGTIPGRVLRARVGDPINFTFAVDAAAATAHSL